MPNASCIETPLLKVQALIIFVPGFGAQTAQVPFESLKRAAKERKSLVDEATRALSGIATLTEEANVTQEGAANQLGTLVEKLSSLKRKVWVIAFRILTVSDS